MSTLKGGASLTRKLQEIADKAGAPGTLRVGFLEGSTYPDGTSMPMVAAVQEFGSPTNNIPPRPYFRSMIAAKSATWGPVIGKILERNGYDARRALLLTGDGIKRQLQQSIKDTNAPPIAPATAAAKGFDKPLIDTGHMWNSVDYEVKS